jgi:probable HAF family extracellular repeat protein
VTVTTGSSSSSRIPLRPIGKNASASGINGLGVVVGNSTASDGFSHAFTYQNGKMTDLGIFTANAINASGQIAGSVSVPGAQSHAVIWSNGTLQDIGTFNGMQNVSASAINDQGEVVGVGSSGYGRGIQVAMIHRMDQMTDLNCLIPANSGWTLHTATGIDNAEQVTGQGPLNGQTRAVDQLHGHWRADRPVRMLGRSGLHESRDERLLQRSLHDSPLSRLSPRTEPLAHSGCTTARASTPSAALSSATLISSSRAIAEAIAARAGASRKGSPS